MRSTVSATGASKATGGRRCPASGGPAPDGERGRGRWRGALDRAWRILAIAAFALAVFWFGHRHSPLNPPAQATVFQSLGDAFAGVPSVWDLQVDPGTVQQATLNGNRIYYTLDKDWRTVSEVLDYYENLYSGPEGQFGGDEPKNPDIEGVDWDEIREEMNDRVSRRGIRLDAGSWGVYGTAVIPDWDEPGWAEEINARAEAAASTGRISELGEAKFVLALRDPGASATTVLAAWPSDDFDVRAVSTDGSEDTPGVDPPDVPRIPGDVRLLSFVQDRSDMAVFMAQYQSSGDATSVLDFYSTRLPQYDWTEDSRVAAVGASLGTAPSVLFVRGRQQCHVTATEDPETRTTVATVVVTGPPGSLH